MNTTFTQENLIQFFYGELSPTRQIELFNALEIDANLKNEYELLKKDMELLDSINESPSKTSVRILLEESSESSSLEGIV